jgi:hypothetical protein
MLGLCIAHRYATMAGQFQRLKFGLLDTQPGHLDGRLLM